MMTNEELAEYVELSHKLVDLLIEYMVPADLVEAAATAGAFAAAMLQASAKEN